ncbi:MAG: nuclear transport factor 2 family protein [Pseudomonadota bacterium]|uniref:nuclear transport factor 2 family protein n=1 Tax=Rhizorhabdus phycosphaerae TaxID=2711156 RepID=UPI0013EC032A|nr:nuclear transport factor 2 family protein [Rhizorhabdus phycosphaerae]
MSRQQNIDLVNRYFQAMHDNDWATVEAMYHDDIVNHMAGTTPASGRIEGKAAMTDELVAAQVHAAMVPEEMQFARRWKVMCADDERVVAIMEGGGPTRAGDRYDQTYCEIFRFEDGKIIEMHAFFDTALAERALFDNPLRQPRGPVAKPLTY